MYNDNYIPVAQILAAPDTTVRKFPSMSSQPNWGFDQIYVLVDGRRVRTVAKSYSRKKDAVAALSKLPEMPPRIPLLVNLDDEGNIVSSRMEIALRKPEPKAATSYMNALLVDKANGGEMTDEALSLAGRYVGMGANASPDERVLNYNVHTAELVSKLILIPAIS